MKKLQFDEEIEKYLIDNYKIKTQQQLSDETGIKKNSIAQWLKTHELYKKKNMFSESDISYMKKHYIDMSYLEIANRLGFTERQIRGKINNMGLKKIRDFNSDYFHVIDTDLKAYFLGFIFADGWVCYNTDNRYYEFGMDLRCEDRYILEILNEELGGVHKIYHLKPCQRVIDGNLANIGHIYRLRVYSKELVFDLMNHGVETNKTLKKTYPVVADNLFFDYLRGYIDGDGCYYNNGYGNNILHITCGTQEPLIYLKEKLKQFEINTTLYKEKDRKYRLLCTNTNDMNRLVHFLYHNGFSLCLDRKYNKIKSYLQKGFAA